MLKTVTGIYTKPSKEAAIALHLLADDSEWENCLEEAQSFKCHGNLGSCSPIFAFFL